VKNYDQNEEISMSMAEAGLKAQDDKRRMEEED
jgi:hypothetical protein